MSKSNHRLNVWVAICGAGTLTLVSVWLLGFTDESASIGLTLVMIQAAIASHIYADHRTAFIATMVVCASFLIATQLDERHRQIVEVSKPTAGKVDELSESGYVVESSKERGIAFKLDTSPERREQELEAAQKRFEQFKLEFKRKKDVKL